VRLTTSGTEVHGDRPWDVVHIDHTLADLELVDEQTGINLGRPWLSIAFDAYSRRVLSFYLTFDNHDTNWQILPVAKSARAGKSRRKWQIRGIDHPGGES
jgi:hypothetical protein